MNVPKGLKFTKEHEWVEIDNDGVATVGISDFAQEQLGDITYIQLPKEGEVFGKDDTFGVVESVKAVSDLYCPIGGRVLEVNQPIIDSPELLNEDPYQDGWLIKLEVKNPDELDDLMSDEEYRNYIEESS